MKKIMRRFLSVGLLALLALSISLSLPAAAAFTPGTPAGIYGTLSGTCTQNSVIPEVLNTTTTITQNPDHAMLRVDLKLVYYTTPEDPIYFSSARNVTSFSHAYPMGVTLDEYPELVYCTHNVLGGWESPIAYAYNQTVWLDFDYLQN